MTVWICLACLPALKDQRFTVGQRCGVCTRPAPCVACEVAVPPPACCDRFAAASARCDIGCRDVCPDHPIVPMASGWALAIRDGGDSGLAISWCPFCGAGLAVTAAESP